MKRNLPRAFAKVTGRIAFEELLSRHSPNEPLQRLPHGGAQAPLRMGFVAQDRGCLNGDGSGVVGAGRLDIAAQLCARHIWVAANITHSPLAALPDTIAALMPGNMLVHTMLWDHSSLAPSGGNHD